MVPKVIYCVDVFLLDFNRSDGDGLPWRNASAAVSMCRSSFSSFSSFSWCSWFSRLARNKSTASKLWKLASTTTWSSLTILRNWLCGSATYAGIQATCKLAKWSPSRAIHSTYQIFSPGVIGRYRVLSRDYSLNVTGPHDCAPNDRALASSGGSPFHFSKATGNAGINTGYAFAGQVLLVCATELIVCRAICGQGRNLYGRACLFVGPTDKTTGLGVFKRRLPSVNNAAANICRFISQGRTNSGQLRNLEPLFL